MTKNAPPAAPVPFAARQSALDANPGRPVDQATLSRLQQNNPRPRLLARPTNSPAVAQRQVAANPVSPDLTADERREQHREQHQQRMEHTPQAQRREERQSAQEEKGRNAEREKVKEGERRRLEK
jgi:hypothetical protein